jgi:hypothetical protein
MLLGIEPRCVVSSSSGQRVLFGAFEHETVVYDLLHHIRSETVHTTFDFGGKRIALSDELDGILAAAYRRFGLALYSVNEGIEVWRRKDIKNIQHVVLSNDGIRAYCGIQDSALAIIDLQTGETIRKIKAARSLHDSPYEKSNS